MIQITIGLTQLPRIVCYMSAEEVVTTWSATPLLTLTAESASRARRLDRPLISSFPRLLVFGSLILLTGFRAFPEPDQRGRIFRIRFCPR
jgi:hypothetical protein